MRTRFAAGLLLAALTSASATAQERIPAQLSIEDAIRIATQYNPAYRKSLNDLEVEDMVVRNRWAAFLPTVSTGLSSNVGRSWAMTGTGPLGETVEADSVRVRESSSASQNMSLSMNLFDGGQTLANLRAARATRSATESGLELERHRLVTDVSREYFAAVRAGKLIELEENLLAARRDELDRTQRLLSVASSKYVDVLSARVNVADAEKSLDDARAAAHKARLVLLERMGVSGEGNFALSTLPPEIFDPAEIDAAQLVTRATAESPMVRRAEAVLFAQSKQVSAATGTRWPTITAGFSMNRSANADGFGRFGSINPDDNRGFSFNLGASLPLFTRFNTSLNVKRAAAAEEDASEDLRAQKLSIERAVRSALIDLGNAYRGVQMAERKADLSREQLAAAEEEYRLGAMTFINLQQIINSAAAAERQMLDAQFTFITNLILLEQQVGSPLER